MQNLGDNEAMSKNRQIKLANKVCETFIGDPLLRGQVGTNGSWSDTGSPNMTSVPLQTSDSVSVLSPSGGTTHLNSSTPELNPSTTFSTSLFKEFIS